MQTHEWELSRNQYNTLNMQVGSTKDKHVYVIYEQEMSQVLLMDRHGEAFHGRCIYYHVGRLPVLHASPIPASPKLVV